MRRFRTCAVVLMAGAVSACDNPLSPEPFSVEIEGPSRVVAQRTAYTTAGTGYSVFTCRATIRAVARGGGGETAEWTGMVMESFDLENRPVGNTLTLSADLARQFWGVATLDAHQTRSATHVTNALSPQRSRIRFVYQVAGDEEVRTATYQFDCV